MTRKKKRPSTSCPRVSPPPGCPSPLCRTIRDRTCRPDSPEAAVTHRASLKCVKIKCYELWGSSGVQSGTSTIHFVIYLIGRNQNVWSDTRLKWLQSNFKGSCVVVLTFETPAEYCHIPFFFIIWCYWDGAEDRNHECWLTFHCCHISFQVFVQFGSFSLPKTEKTWKPDHDGSWHSGSALKTIHHELSADHLLVELCHHLLKHNISGLIGFAKFLQDLRDKQTNKQDKQTSVSHPAASQPVNQFYLNEWSRDEMK